MKNLLHIAKNMLFASMLIISLFLFACFIYRQTEQCINGPVILNPCICSLFGRLIY